MEGSEEGRAGAAGEVGGTLVPGRPAAPQAVAGPARRRLEVARQVEELRGHVDHRGHQPVADAVAGDEYARGPAQGGDEVRRRLRGEVDGGDGERGHGRLLFSQVRTREAIRAVRG